MVRLMLSVAVAWKRKASMSRLPTRPREAPRIVVAGKPGVAMSVKRALLEVQPSLLAGPNCGSTSSMAPAGAMQVGTGKAAQAVPVSIKSSENGAVEAPPANGAIQT